MQQVSYGTVLCILVVVEFAVMAGMKLMTASRDTDHFFVPDHEERVGCSILTPIPRVVRDILDRIGVFHLVRFSSCEAAPSFRVFQVFTQIDSTGIDRTSIFLNIKIGTG